MARAALRPRTAFRLRTASDSGTPKPDPRAPKPDPPATKSRFRRGKADRETTEPPRERRRPPLVVRVLVMLLAFAAMVAFAAALARLTLQPSPASEALTHNNFHPGQSLRAYLDQPELRDAFKQVGGNILLGVPFGVLLPLLIPGTRGILKVILLTATVMFLVELVQGSLITGRAFDVDDVILNTTGALIGYLLLGRRMSRAVHPRRLDRKA
ncbi:VanZ family protein [Streptomyces beigongshangae]|uniref:VanZ family protein n=1 Tax=Streptomyces beigongshangae TaxID=2841597 RepID=UPI001C8465E2|nr:VanZ family protein [Streptomyces sp. REN17]